MNLTQAGLLRCRLCFSLILFYLTCTTCDSRILYAMEGDEVNLEFPYPCNSTDATLQLENRTPFYNSADPKSLTLHPSQFNRISVKDTFKDGICLLQLNISHVNRHDPGTYILLAQNNGYTKRVGLHVDFVPGKAKCRRNEVFRTGHWVTLVCIAPVGSMAGQIQCYQDGVTMPSLSSPTETWRTLQQTLLVRQSNRRHGRVSCCSSTLVELKERCECNDFVWDPVLDSESDMKDPCSTASTTNVIEHLKTNTTQVKQSPKKELDNPKLPSGSSQLLKAIPGFFLAVVLVIALLVIRLASRYYNVR